ncbi:Gfo/Idh/MocA family oxidoreductase [Janthinobacterium sp. PLB04]|uniref:Gfo/Idh/MocA family oxidoreductase n=1 Tax=Janthinobacterium lividum TaxID=29581 RepID=A0AAJ4T7J0_9BURK|nr:MULTISPECIES: Gfo/Idh/MocA family oxidoreductase [Janthinobacterium]KAB0324601.1 oxidoreductase [Janthinobacterium lividum]MBR7632465.1 Gfo/Idh/MocA family oxidoreductase [Janthinobacterium lividum]QSX98705.1 Gfo/Idh/MocA family oxidoreductase [Janthinobacterium lividum]UGQ38680.1 Gfo/Idh/MocA family oxidoreductase [Janthinobacterium sp. PLB04]
MSSPTLKVGIVGLGRLGQRHAINLAQRVPNAEVVAACSPVPAELDWAASTLGITTAYADYDALLAHPGLDAVFLVTPTSLHADQIIAALRAGKHVFCEKPLSLDLADCLKVEAEAARHPQLTIMIGFVRRFDASYHDAQQKIAQGLIGKPYLVRSQTCDQNDPSGAFMRFAPTSGGIFLDCSVHDIDLARWLLGNPVPKRVYASGTNAIHTGLQAFGDVDNGLATVEFSDGSMASFMASRTMAHGHETLTEVFGTGGRLAVGSNPRLNRVEISDAHGVRNECTPDFYARFADAFLIEAQEFTDAALGRRTLSLTLHDATEATRIGLAMTQAMREARPVEF